MDSDFMFVELPSQFKLYSNFDKTKFGIRCLKGKDEKILAEANETNLNKKFIQVLRSVIMGIDPLELTLGDKKFITLWLAINSVSKDFNIEFKCKNCLQDNKDVTIDLSTEINSVDLPADYSEPKSITLSNGDTVQVKLLRVKDELELEEFMKTGKNIWIYRYALSLINEMNILEKIEYLENLKSADLMKIRAVQEIYDHGPEMKVTKNCVHCDAEESVALPFRIEMLIPYGEALKRYYGNGM